MIRQGRVVWSDMEMPGAQGTQSHAIQLFEQQPTPSIFVGLGGTGTEIVGRVKARLERIFRERRPDILTKLAYRCFDIEDFAKRSQIVKDALDEAEEFLTIGGGVHPYNFVTQNIHQEDLASWWSNDLTAICRNFEAFTAARRYRQVGRLAAYVSFDQIEDRLKKAAHAAAGRSHGFTTPAHIVPRVYIVSSCCGGTGSGMFLDISLMTWEALAGPFRARPLVTGAVVLPEFYSAQNTSLKAAFEANACAFFEEAELFARNPLLFKRHCIKPSLYQERGGRPFPDHWTPWESCFLISHHFGMDSVITESHAFLNYAADLLLYCWLGLPWSTSNKGFENEQAELADAQDEFGRRKMYSTSGLQIVAYPAEPVRRYVLSSAVVNLLTTWALGAEHSESTINDAADSLYEAIRQPIKDAEKKMGDFIRNRVPTVSLSEESEDVRKDIQLEWERVQQDSQKNAEVLLRELRSTLAGGFQNFLDHVQSKVDNFMDTCPHGLKFADKVLDKATGKMRERRLELEKEMEECATKVNACESELSAELPLPARKARGRRTAVKTVLEQREALLRAFWHNYVRQQGLAKILSELEPVVGRSPIDRDNYLSRHDEGRGALKRSLQNEGDRIQKQIRRLDSEMSVLYASNRHVHFRPQFRTLQDVEDFKRVSELVRDIHKGDPDSARELVDELREQLERSGLSLHDVERPELVARQLVESLRAFVEERVHRLGGFPGLLDALSETTHGPEKNLSSMVADMVQRVSLCCLESPGYSEVGRNKKRVLFVPKMAVNEVDPRAIRDRGLTDCLVMTGDAEAAVFELALAFSVVVLKHWPEWQKALEASRQGRDFPHIHREWNPPGSIGDYLEIRGAGASVAARLSFILGRFVQSLLEDTDIGAELGGQELDKLRNLFRPPDELAPNEGGPVSWVDLIKSDKKAHYYAVLLQRDADGRFSESARRFLADSLIQAFKAYCSGHHYEVIDRSTEVMDTILRYVDHDALSSAAELYLKKVGGQLTGSSEPERRLLQDLYETFRDWYRRELAPIPSAPLQPPPEKVEPVRPV